MRLNGSTLMIDWRLNGSIDLCLRLRQTKCYSKDPEEFCGRQENESNVAFSLLFDSPELEIRPLSSQF